MRFAPSIALFLLWPVLATAHDKTTHADAHTQIMAAETLSISNIPVTDSSYATAGFVERFGQSGTLILSFTYTNCETLCPVTNAILSEVDSRIAGEDLTIVSVSIDPAADTPAALATMAAELQSSENWVWLTAAPRENRMLLQELGVDVASLETHDPVFLIGDLCSGKFTRIIGLADPASLVDLARHHPKCGN
jgi:protein SCO1